MFKIKKYKLNEKIDIMYFYEISDSVNLEKLKKTKPKVIIIENINPENNLLKEIKFLGYNISCEKLNYENFGYKLNKEIEILVASFDFIFNFKDLYIEEYENSQSVIKSIEKSIIRQTEKFLKKDKFENVEIYNANSEYIIDYFISNNIKVNHIITDPPYAISKENNFNTLKNRKGLDFGKWDNSFEVLSWIEKYVKLLDKNGSIIIFCSYRNISYIVDELEKCGLVVKDFIEWKKTNPMPRNVERRYVQDTEFAIWAVNKNSKWIFNKEKEKAYLRSSFSYPIVSGSEKVAHPTQKSLALLREIIKIHTNKNDIILDPFMGSGSSGIASILEDRKFIGVEISEFYYNLALKRFSNYFTTI